MIGEDGPAGIRVGPDGAEAEAFAAFQSWARRLGRRGILLAVCSKNDDRPPVRRSNRTRGWSFASPILPASWQTGRQASNLREIARRLNIGLDSLVFVDDEPSERALVRHMLPEVAVPEMSPDPSDYIQDVEKHRYFQTVTLAAEDLRRTEYYRGNEAREELAAATGSLESTSRLSA